MASGHQETSTRPGATVTPTTRPWARAVAFTFYVVALFFWIRSFGIPSDTVQIFVWLWLATIAFNIGAPWRSHLGFLRDWWLPVVGLVIYFYSRGLADEFGFTPHVQMPITVDEWIGGGTTPTEHLQDALCGTPCDPNSAPAWYDIALSFVYSTHFFTGLVIAVVLWLRNRGEWMKWMRRYVGINAGALVVYILYPMAPPWMAAEEGYLPETIVRITHRGWSGVGLDRFHLVLTGVGNPVAAMPSLHAGIAFLIAIYAIQRFRSPVRWLLLAYPLTMSFALVYNAEHYVIDIVAGIALASFVLAASSWWERIRDDPEAKTATPTHAEVDAKQSSGD